MNLIFLQKKINGNEINFSILIQSDTGFYDSENDKPLDVESFLNVEEATTKIIFVLGKNCWHPDYKDDFENASPLYKKDAPEYIKISDNEVLLAKAFRLTDFLNLDTTIKCLEEWINFCGTNGITEIEISK
jgi:hypothetical protein